MHILKRNPIEPAEPEILQRKRPQLRLCQRSPPLKDGKLLTDFLLNLTECEDTLEWEPLGRSGVFRAQQQSPEIRNFPQYLCFKLRFSIACHFYLISVSRSIVLILPDRCPEWWPPAYYGFHSPVNSKHNQKYLIFLVKFNLLNEQCSCPRLTWDVCCQPSAVEQSSLRSRRCQLCWAQSSQHRRPPRSRCRKQCQWRATLRTSGPWRTETRERKCRTLVLNSEKSGYTFKTYFSRHDHFLPGRGKGQRGWGNRSFLWKRNA